MILSNDSTTQFSFIFISDNYESRYSSYFFCNC